MIVKHCNHAPAGYPLAIPFRHAKAW